MSTQPIPDLATVTFRIQAAEDRIKDMQTQLHQYELARENDLKIQVLRTEIGQLARDQAEIKTQQAEIRTLIVAADKDRIAADAKQTESQLKLMNRVLYSFVGAIGAVLIGVAIFVLTHVAL